MPVISSDVVVAGQPYRQNICVSGRAVRESDIDGVTVVSSTEIGVTRDDTKLTGVTIVSTRLPATPWRLCVKPVGTA